MGSSESKMSETAATKPDRVIPNQRLSELADPRSPSVSIDRTPIQIGGIVSRTSALVKRECPLAFTDPRSPTVGISRTPVRETVRATVDSFARRLGWLFHNEAEVKDSASNLRPCSVEMEEDGIKDDELASAEPLITPHLCQNFGSIFEHSNLQAAPMLPPLHSVGESSPFVVVEAPQAQVNVETEADYSLEEAEEARETPVHKRLSMSLITCHNGATSTQIFAEVHRDSPSSPEPAVEVEPLEAGIDHAYTEVHPDSPSFPEPAVEVEPLEAGIDHAYAEVHPDSPSFPEPAVEGEPLEDGIDHAFALPPVSPEPECPDAPVEPPVTSTADVPVVSVSPEEPDDVVQTLCSGETEELVVAQDCLLPEPTASELPAAPSPVPSRKEPLVCTGIRCPNLNSKSPSQAVFKPQWLGKGFGAPALRARGVQGRVRKGGSSPLAVQVAVKNAVNENKGPSAKLKQKGIGRAEGRSPLQLLKETNSPRDQRPQKKLKVSTPDRQRLGLMDRRVLSVALDKENR
ncbi:cell division cycle-associated protein 3 [Genypterus blacodes]|uniref:cell division cycle-associated protein 3 n=1 Tax=Genypterus blacodes TaxID=154954 RepID=UPI003F762C21